MKKRLSSFVIYKILFGLIALSVIAYGRIQHTSSINQYEPKDNTICFQTNCFDLVVLTTEEQRQKGMMGIESWPTGSGMLFVFAVDDYYTFWMKNTLIPLDAIWMDAQGKIVDIQYMTPCIADPCPTYRPSSPARYVLEING